MPVVHVYLLEGRPPDRIRALMARITEAVCGVLDVAPERVRVIVSEVPRSHWAVAGVAMDQRPSPDAGGAGPPAAGPRP